MNLEELRKLQQLCIRLNFIKPELTKEFFDAFKAFAPTVPELLRLKGFPNSEIKESTVAFIKTIMSHEADLKREDTFDDGKKEISKCLITLQRELTS